MNLTDLATFVHVAAEGTFSAAAARLEVPKSTVSRRVTRLEDALGVQLLRRSARSFVLTDEGRVLHARVAPLLREVAQIEHALVDAPDAPRGTLRITAPPDASVFPGFSELIAAYRARCPDVVLQIDLTNRMVDLLEEGFDVAIRAYAGNLPGGTGLMARTMGRSVPFLFASQSWVDAHPDVTAQTLGDHQIVSHVALQRLPLNGPEGEIVAMPPAKLLCNDFRLLTDLLCRGCGVGLLSADAAEAQGSLVRVLPGWAAPTARWALVWPQSRYLSPRVRIFLDLAQERMTGA